MNLRAEEMSLTAEDNVIPSLAAMSACLLLVFSCACAAGAQERWKQDHVIVTFWCPPPATDEALAAVAAEHYTMTWTPVAGLDVAHRHGLRVMLQDPLLTPASLDDPRQKARLDELVDRVKDHPALAAYFITDEPSAAAFPALGRLVAYLRERDPARVAYINLFPIYATDAQLGTEGDRVAAYREHLRQYVEIVKPALISYDHYQFFKDGDQPLYFLNLALIRQAALGARVPFLNIIQASTIERAWRLPNANELRFLVYTTLAYGGRGISYFLYWGPASYGGMYQDGKRMPSALDAAKLNAEINALSPELMKLDSLGVYHSQPLPEGGEAIPGDSPVQIIGAGEFVLGLFGASDRVTAFVVVNRDHRQSASARLKLPAGTRGVAEFDRAARVWRGYARAAESIVVSLDPGDGRLFRLAR